MENQTAVTGCDISRPVRGVTIQELAREQLPLGSLFSPAGHPSMDPFAGEPQLPLLDDHRRLKFWEVEEFFKCPVAGWCLDLAEQREILRKEGISTKGKSNLQIHEILVESLDDENPLSRRIDFWLNRKYQKEVNELSSLEPEEFIKRWEASVEKERSKGNENPLIASLQKENTQHFFDPFSVSKLWGST